MLDEFVLWQTDRPHKRELPSLDEAQFSLLKRSNNIKSAWSLSTKIQLLLLPSYYFIKKRPKNLVLAGTSPDIHLLDDQNVLSSHPQNSNWYDVYNHHYLLSIFGIVFQVSAAGGTHKSIKSGWNMTALSQWYKKLYKTVFQLRKCL